MTKLDKKALARAIEAMERHTEKPLREWEIIAIEAAITAYLEATASAEAVVKPLEWRDHRGQTFPDTWTAKTPGGVYEIEERSGSDSPFYVTTGPLHVFISDKDSLDEAKEAAQADYEKRILSALAPRPPEASISAVTPEMIAAAWGAWKKRHKDRIGPGPGFVEALEAALGQPAAPSVNMKRGSSLWAIC